MAPGVGPRATHLATPVDLRRQRNAGDDDLGRLLDPAYREPIRRIPAGRQVFRGLPFLLARREAGRRWLLLDRPIEVDLRSYGPVNRIVVAHFCDAWRGPDGRPSDLPIGWVTPVGQAVAEYRLESIDGGRSGGTVRRRFEINEGIVGWGQGAFAARPHQLDQPLEWSGPYPAQEPARYAAPGEAGLLAILPGTWGPAQTGVADSVPSPTDDIALWLYEIEVANAPVVVSSLRLEPLAQLNEGGGVVVAAITVYRGADSPLRLGPRRTLRLERRTPARGAGKNPRLGRPTLAVDLGLVIRERAAPAAVAADGWPSDSIPGWGSARSAVSSAATMIDVAMASEATIAIEGDVVDARRLPPDGRRRRYGAITIEPLPIPSRRIDVEVVDAATGDPMPARVHFHAADGRYLAPLGHREEINPGLNEDDGADLVLGDTTYAYVAGRFPIELPPGTVHVEAARGFGYRPLRRTIDVERLTVASQAEPRAGPRAGR